MSKSLEYAYNHYGVYALANAIGKGDSAKLALVRASKVFELFETTTRFFRPKRSDGKWTEPFKPTMILPEGQAWRYEVHDYEGSAWQYLSYVPHNVIGLSPCLAAKKSSLISGIQYSRVAMKKAASRFGTSLICLPFGNTFMQAKPIECNPSQKICSKEIFVSRLMATRATTIQAHVRRGMCGRRSDCSQIRSRIGVSSEVLFLPKPS